MKKTLFTDAVCGEDQCHDIVLDWKSPTFVTGLCTKCLYIKDMDLAKPVEVTNEI